MLILHDPVTLLHKSTEILDGQLMPALESPERIEAIIAAIQNDWVTNSDPALPRPTTRHRHELHTVQRGNNVVATAVDFLMNLYEKKTHDKEYLEHLRTCFNDHYRAGKVKIDGCVLPECFRVPPGYMSSASGSKEPPKDMAARPGFWAFDMSAGLGKDSFASIKASARLAVEGAYWVMQGNYPTKAPYTSENPRSLNEGGGSTVMSLCRPPGHHCDTKMAGGYCYMNNAVLAVHAFNYMHKDVVVVATGKSRRDVNDPRIAILDIDFHHGNGTQEYFYRNETVQYTSIHGKDEYPYYSGDEIEQGDGEGFGMNWNHPIPKGSSADVYLKTLDAALMDIRRFKPEFLIISLGFDTYHNDPLGSFQIQTDDYRRIAGRIRTELKGVPSLILLEGGYVIEDLGANVLSFLKGWVQAERHDVPFKDTTKYDDSDAQEFRRRSLDSDFGDFLEGIEEPKSPKWVDSPKPDLPEPPLSPEDPMTKSMEDVSVSEVTEDAEMGGSYDMGR